MSSHCSDGHHATGCISQALTETHRSRSDAPTEIEAENLEQLDEALLPVTVNFISVGGIAKHVRAVNLSIRFAL